ncbi:MAG: hypothetical protein GEU81_11100 [Nitriliruptorales bacterium]|nr:hypothetical protein [Nitriliruptorales bacterium]
MAEQRPTVQRSAVLPASRDRVWSALTTSSELSRWFGAAVELDPRPGGWGRFTDGRGTRTARVIDVRWGQRLDLVWWPEGADPGEGGSEVSIQVEETPQGTRVVVTETAPASTEAAQAAFQASAAWTSRADRLGAHLSAVLV